jgi:hypothetical protein
MTHRFRYAFAIAACLFIAGVFVGCGGDDSPSPTPASVKGRAVVKISIAPPIPLDLSTALRNTLEDRLISASTHSTIAMTTEDQVGIDFDGPHSVNFVRDLVITPGVRFKRPVLDGTKIKCKDTSGNEFSVDPQFLELSGNLPVCVGPDNRPGEIEWEPATAQINGSERQLDGAMLRKNAVALPTNENGDPVLNADFNDDGKAVLQAVTKELAGGACSSNKESCYPLDVFLGDSLLVAGKIQREIQNGRITLAGASREAMEELGAVIQGGELPAAVTARQHRTAIGGRDEMSPRRH